MKPQCRACKVDLDYIGPTEPWSDEHYMCPICHGTYCIFQFCEFCAMETHTREHHLIPRCKGGKVTAHTCETCESYIHKTWTHNELRDTYNNVETILADASFQKFLKWRRKQPPTALFKSETSNNRDRRKFS